MKTLLYSLIAVLLLGNIAPGFNKRETLTSNIIIQTEETQVSPSDLAQSAKIISARLGSYSSAKYELTVIPEKNQIAVSLSDKWDINMAERLLIQKGEVSFNEGNVQQYSCGDKGVIMTGADIESIKTDHLKKSAIYSIEIRFRKEAINKWAEATKLNLDKAIAFVLDNNVLYAPVVKSEIKNGHCSITGNFTEAEAKFIASVGNNGILPVSFKVVR